MDDRWVPVRYSRAQRTTCHRSHTRRNRGRPWSLAPLLAPASIPSAGPNRSLGCRRGTRRRCGSDSRRSRSFFLGFRWHEEVIHCHTPARHGRLGVGHLAPPENGWCCGVARAIDAHHIFTEQVDVPDDQGTGCEVVGALRGAVPGGGRLVVIFVLDLNGEDRSALEEAHPGRWTEVVSCARAER